MYHERLWALVRLESGMTPSEAILKYAKDHHKHIENRLGLCDPSQGDRCDITAAYRHAAQIAEATP